MAKRPRSTEELRRKHADDVKEAIEDGLNRFIAEWTGHSSLTDLDRDNLTRLSQWRRNIEDHVYEKLRKRFAIRRRTRS
jgi:hypothetical protein